MGPEILDNPALVKAVGHTIRERLNFHAKGSQMAYEPMRRYVDYLESLAVVGGGTKSNGGCGTGKLQGVKFPDTQAAYRVF
ncbi:MAG: hypothetical protein WCP06_12950, partial [Verrucomicrobiota bacterium]